MNKSRADVKLCPAAGRRISRAHAQPQPLHRLKEVLEQEGISIRSVARRMNVSAARVRQELDERQNLQLTDLYRWRAALNVPLVDLLVAPGNGLSESIKFRAKLLKLMKTLRTIQERVTDERVSRLCQRLEHQLLDIMPELKHASSWPSVGQRRTLDELGAIVSRIFTEATFADGNDPSGRDE